MINLKCVLAFKNRIKKNNCNLNLNQLYCIRLALKPKIKLVKRHEKINSIWLIKTEFKKIESTKIIF